MSRWKSAGFSSPYVTSAVGVTFQRGTSKVGGGKALGGARVVWVGTRGGLLPWRCARHARSAFGILCRPSPMQLMPTTPSPAPPPPPPSPPQAWVAFTGCTPTSTVPCAPARTGGVYFYSSTLKQWVLKTPIPADSGDYIQVRVDATAANRCAAWINRWATVEVPVLTGAWAG